MRVLCRLSSMPRSVLRLRKKEEILPTYHHHHHLRILTTCNVPTVHESLTRVQRNAISLTARTPGPNRKPLPWGDEQISLLIHLHHQLIDCEHLVCSKQTLNFIISKYHLFLLKKVSHLTAIQILLFISAFETIK